MRWANFLHIYQPINQAQDILKQVVNQSYRRIFRGLKEISGCRITLNISAALSELLLREGYDDVINDIQMLAANGRLEFTETAKYHAFLPYLSEQEIERQIVLNHETNQRIFGDVYAPVCFFPPEMAYDAKVARVVSRLGYRVILIDEIAFSGKTEKTPYDAAVTVEDLPLVAVFRDRRLSNLVISAVARRGETFYETLGEEAGKERYLLTAMDGETFGHHRPGLEEFLFELHRSSRLAQIFVSEIPRYFPPRQALSPRPSTWASSEYDLEHNLQFHSWRDPNNILHQKQWELSMLAINEVNTSEGEKEFSAARALLDPALASDQFFWASNRPWWSLEMIESGAWDGLRTVEALGEGHRYAQERARALYHEIISTAFSWQREGKIRKESHEMREAIKVPFKERTLEAQKPEVYHAFIDLMKQEMENAANAKDYERAILWRDAIWKIETKNDIYDAIHATDLLRHKLPLGEIEELMDKYKEEYKKIRGGQAEDRR